MQHVVVVALGALAGCSTPQNRDAIDSGTDSAVERDAGADASIDAATVPVEKLVFITTARWNGALGGLSGADAKCQAEAVAAGRTGTFAAWLGDATGGPASRFTKGNVKYVRADGVLVAIGWTDLVDGTLAAPINVTAMGATSAAGSTWTNVDVDGTTDFTIYDCDNWSISTSEADGALGAQQFADYRWTRSTMNGLVTSCFFEEQLYCFEQ